MRIQCQKTYLNRRRCKYWAYGDGKLCRWHKIMEDFRSDYKIVPSTIPQYLVMYGVYGALSAFGLCLWMLSKEPAIIWPLVGLVALGLAFSLFADAIMAKDYPLSQLTFWPKMLALGLGLMIIGGLAAIAAVFRNPELGRPVIQLFTKNPDWPAAPPLLVTALTIQTAVYITMFVRKILFKDILFFNSSVWMVALMVAGASFQPLIHSGLSIRPDFSEKFWEGVLGKNVGIPTGIAFFAGFMIAEVINVQMRRYHLDDAGFKSTFMISYPACIFPIMIGMFISRYALQWINVSGAFAFVVLAVIISIPLSVITSRWVVRLGKRSP